MERRPVIAPPRGSKVLGLCVLGLYVLAGAALSAGCSPRHSSGSMDSGSYVELRRQLEDEHDRAVIDDDEYQRRREELIQQSFGGYWI